MKARGKEEINLMVMEEEDTYNEKFDIVKQALTRKHYRIEYESNCNDICIDPEERVVNFAHNGSTSSMIKSLNAICILLDIGVI